MKKIAFILFAVSAVCLACSGDLAARGGRGGGGGGARGGGGGYSRPAPSRTPSVSRPSPQPAARPATRPSTGTRPGTGTRPSQGDVQKFLDPSKPAAGTRPSPGGSGGGAAADFLNKPESGQRPNAGERPGARPGADSERPRTADGLAGNRPDRIDNRGERSEQRLGRRDEVRDQFKDHHPRYDFWRDNPNAARWRWNRPYRWATWGLVTGFFPWGWKEPVYYSYGDNIYYEDNSVYYGDKAVASSDEYAEQGQKLAASAPEVDDSVEWLTLGVFAVTQDGQESGPPPTLFIQLAVNKQGIIAGTFQNTATEQSQPIEGMVDKKTQRTAWTIVDKKWPIMESGVSNLTKDTAPALVHFENGQTQQWLLVRLEEPEGEAPAQ